MRVRDPRLLVVVSAMLLGAAVAFPLGVIASHQFTDVPDSSTYHDDIDAIRDAGITTGCGLNLYCPKAYVTREQMAAFMNRLGALQAGKTPVVKAATAQNADDANQLDGLESTQFARSDVAATGTYRCGPHEAQPQTADLAWVRIDTNGGLYVASGSSGSFACSVHLPDGATITEFALSAYDSSPTESISCQMDRWDFDVDPNLDPMAEVTTGVAANPTFLQVTDATVVPAVVDTAQYSYTTECTFNGSGADLAFYGTLVKYTIVGLPVE